MTIDQCCKGQQAIADRIFMDFKYTKAGSDEQLRALENNMSIHVGYISSSPLSVDTKNDLIEVKKLMENNE